MKGKKSKPQKIEYMKKYRIKNKEKINKKINIYKHLKNFGGNRDKVLERDNWQCQECGMNNEQHIVIFGKSLNVHHKDGNGRYSEKPNNNIDNLITLCHRCHVTIENPARKLTEEQVKEIKYLLNNKIMGCKKIGDKFNVSKVTIGAIKNGKTWRNIKCVE